MGRFCERIPRGVRVHTKKTMGIWWSDPETEAEEAVADVDYRMREIRARIAIKSRSVEGKRARMLDTAPGVSRDNLAASVALEVDTIRSLERGLNTYQNMSEKLVRAKTRYAMSDLDQIVRD